MKYKCKKHIKGFSPFYGVIILLISLICSSFKNGDNEKKENVEDIISKMTLEQKAELLIGTGMVSNLPDSILAKFGLLNEMYNDPEYVKMVDRIRTYLPGAAGFTSEFNKLGITS